MKILIDKVKAGSPITEEDLVAAIKNTLNRQAFNDFYKGLYDDYISGIAKTPEEKQKISNMVTDDIILLFSPIFSLLPRVNRKPDDVGGFIAKHFGHKGFKINDHLGAGRIDAICNECKSFMPIKSTGE